MIRLTTLFLIAVAALTIAATTALAVPRALQYQGRLTDAAGEPLTQSETVVFSIYGDPEGGAALWTEEFANLTLDHGRFSVMLGGSAAPFTSELLAAIHEGRDLFLGIRVGGDPEMAPRQAFASVAYGLHSEAADSAAYAQRAGAVDSAGYAQSAGEADSAERARSADTAVSAQTAVTAQTAASAQSAAFADSVLGLPGLSYTWIDHKSVSVGASTTVATIDLMAPEAGYFLVTATGTLVLDNLNAKGSTCLVNIGEDRNGSPETTMGLVTAVIDTAALMVSHYVPFTCQRVYAKRAGSYEFNLNVRNKTGDRKVTVNQPSITAIFVPKAVGTVEARP